MGMNNVNVTECGLPIPTPSPSINGALLALCRVTWRNDYSDAEFRGVVSKIVVSYEPENTVGIRLTADDLISFFDDLSADEYLALAGADVSSNVQKGAAWE